MNEKIIIDQIKDSLKSIEIYLDTHTNAWSLTKAELYEAVRNSVLSPEDFTSRIETSDLDLLIIVLSISQSLLVIAEYDDNLSKKYDKIAEYCSELEFNMDLLTNIQPENHKITSINQEYDRYIQQFKKIISEIHEIRLLIVTNAVKITTGLDWLSRLFRLGIYEQILPTYRIIYDLATELHNSIQQKLHSPQT